MKPLALKPLCLVALGAPAFAQDAQLAPPANLTGERYSATAAEIFWDRVNDSVLMYEIARDGTVVAQNDGTSYFTTALEGGTAYRFSVIAVMMDGTRSPTSTITVPTRDGSTGGGSTGGGASGGDSGPPAPTNARIEVYSDTAAELFFDRYPAEANVTGVEVIRDGQTLATIDGTSFFDDTRAPGRSYAYELIAIAGDGSRSGAATIGGTGGGTGGGTAPNDGPTIDLTNAIPVENATEPASLPVLLEIARGEPLDRTVSDVGTVLTDQYPENRIADQGQVDVTINCTDGGTANVVSNRSGQLLTQGWTFASCQQGELLLEGSYRYESDESTETVFFDFGAAGSPFTITNETGDVREIVGRSETTLLPDIAPGALRKTWTIESYRLDRASGTDLGVTGLSSTYEARGELNQYLKLFETSFTADAGFGSPVTVMTPTRFEGTGEESSYTVGRLTAEAGSGAALGLDADTGMRQTFMLTLTMADGSTTSTMENFTESLNFPVSIEGLTPR